MTPGLQEIVRLGALHPLNPDCDHFYFLRHGQTARNALRIFQAPDEPLNDTGMAQAKQAALLLAGEPIRTIVCSDARRAHDTAHTVAEALRLTPTATEQLRERNFGALIGTSSVNIDWSCDPENGESLEVFMRRKHAALSHALAQRPTPVLVVAHGGSLYALAAMLQVPIDLKVLGNAQPLRFERTGPTWSMRPLQEQEVDGAASLA